MILSDLRTRFAPSPTGHLHLGHARAAFEAFEFAQARGGTCLLRIEDIDHTRCRSDYTRGIYADLDWLGLNWPLPVRVQSVYRKDYMGVIANLVERGLAYACTQSRSALKAGALTGPDVKLTFDERDFNDKSDCSLLSLNNAICSEVKKQEIVLNYLSMSLDLKNPTLPFAIRLNLSNALKNISDQSLEFLNFENQPRKEALIDADIRDARPLLATWANSDRPDPIVARRDIGTSYDIAVTHDDMLQSISHVVRGKDLEAQTPLHVLIQTLMGWPTPTYYHHDLVLREDGEKLAKRNLDTALASLREEGQSVVEVKRLAGLG